VHQVGQLLRFKSKVSFGTQATHFKADIRVVYEAALRMSSLDLNRARGVC